MARTKPKRTPAPAKPSFPIWLMIAGIGLILVAVWAFASSTSRQKTTPEVAGAPSIRVDEETFDYGNVKLGEKPIQTVVTVTNTGDQTLTFTETPYIEVVEGC